MLTATQPADAAKIDAAPKWDLFAAPNFTMPFNVTGYAPGSGLGLTRSDSARRQAVPGTDLTRRADAFEKATAIEVSARRS
jgi:aspartyl-tRNA(Asn)/glutamyl-tRNA(Gln) amidotransferase subunit A